MGRARNGTRDLETTGEALASWRRQYGGRGRKIPEAFWNTARELARVHGVEATARALRINPRRLAASVDGTPAVAPTIVQPDAFVELSGVQVGIHDHAAVVEFFGREGEGVRVRVAASAVDIVALAGAFWSRRP